MALTSYFFVSILLYMKKKVVFIGNSIVNGFPLKRSQCFVSLVREASGWEAINKGINGDSTSRILSRFERDVICHLPDAVFILTGTNDFIFEEASPEAAFDNISRMLKLSEENGIRAVLITPLPVDEAMASSLWIPEADYAYVNSALGDISEKIRNSGNEFIDMNALYKNCGKYLDGVHPTAEGHRYIADAVLEYIGVNFTD